MFLFRKNGCCVKNAVLNTRYLILLISNYIIRYNWINLYIKLRDDPGFDEFLKAHQRGANKTIWDNDALDGQASTSKTDEVDSDSDGDEVGKDEDGVNMEEVAEDSGVQSDHGRNRTFLIREISFEWIKEKYIKFTTAFISQKVLLLGTFLMYFRIQL